ncbi:uncharacterized protein LOC143453322 [Clavelina lepadiformis]|uniref:uncharacterized protein LOC143453322 n=1 Tax=Clavelina lepadiformis TaxID=159417 RepID=UPI004042169E
MRLAGNETNQTEYEVYMKWKQADWIIPVTVNALLMAATAWITLSLVHYGIRNKKWAKTKMRNAEKLNGGIVYTSTVVCGVTTLIRLANSQSSFNIGFGNDYDEECERISDAEFALYCLVLLSVYFFQWLRQGIFYANNMLHNNFSTGLKVVSAGSIVFIILAGVSAVLVNTIPVNYPSSPEGCIYKESEEIGATAWIVCVVVIVIGQLLLVGLFIYPFKAEFVQSVCGCCPGHTKDKATISSDRKTSIATIISLKSRSASLATLNVPDSQCSKKPSPKSVRRCRRESKRKTVVKQIMQRTIAFSVVTLVTDIILVVFSHYVIGSEGNRRISNIVYDINSFLNLIFVVCSFLSCKGMLLSPILSKDAVTEKRETSSTNFSGNPL